MPLPTRTAENIQRKSPTASSIPAARTPADAAFPRKPALRQRDSRAMHSCPLPQATILAFRPVRAIQLPAKKEISGQGRSLLYILQTTPSTGRTQSMAVFGTEPSPASATAGDKPAAAHAAAQKLLRRPACAQATPEMSVHTDPHPSAIESSAQRSYHFCGSPAASRIPIAVQPPTASRGPKRREIPPQIKFTAPSSAARAHLEPQVQSAHSSPTAKSV